MKVKRNLDLTINLWVRDKTTGHVHQVGTDRSDALVFLSGAPHYYNAKSGKSTMCGYEWVDPELMSDGVVLTDCVGKNLKMLINEKGLTVKELASISYCAQSTISNYINKGCMPSLPCVASLAKALGVTIDELVRGTRKMEVAK